jgi:hypothetical protein
MEMRSTLFQLHFLTTAHIPNLHKIYTVVFILAKAFFFQALVLIYLRSKNIEYVLENFKNVLHFGTRVQHVPTITFQLVLRIYYHYET